MKLDSATLKFQALICRLMLAALTLIALPSWSASTANEVPAIVLIGFAGPRVIENTVREKLPEGFQRAEFLVTKGAIDMIVDRRKMREEIARLLALLQNQAAETVS